LLGLSAKEVDQLKAAAAGATGLQQKGACATTRIILARARDPAVDARVNAAKFWLLCWQQYPQLRQRIKEVWLQLRAQYRAGAGWGKVTGPISAMVKMLIDLGWDPIAPHVWVDPQGGRWQYSGAGTSEFLRNFKATVQDTVWRRAAQQRNGGGLQRGFSATLAEGAVRALENEARASPGIMQPDTVRSLAHVVMAAGTWPYQRRFAAQRVSDPTCPRCGLAPEDDLHRFWQCPANQQLQQPQVVSTNHLEDMAQRQAPSCPALWLRALVPVAALDLPEPPAARTIHSYGNWARAHHRTTLYLDGSGGANAASPELMRVGWAVVAMDGPDFVAAQFGAVEDRQAAGRAEMVAAIQALRIAINDDWGHVSLASDYATLVAGFARVSSIYHPGMLQQACIDMFDGSDHSRLRAEFWQLAFVIGVPQITLRKVKAHAEPQHLVKGLLNVDDPRGNVCADAFAAVAAWTVQLPAHAVAHYHELGKLASSVLARQVCITAVCAALPAIPERDLPRRDPAEPRRRRRRERLAAWARAGHAFQPTAYGWLCARCGMRGATSSIVWQLRTNPACRALQVERTQGIHASHPLRRHRGITWCTVCGCWTVRGAQSLRAPCSGTASRAGRQALAKLQGSPPKPPRAGMQWPADP